MSLRLGYRPVDAVEHVVYMPDFVTIDKDTGERTYTKPIGDKDAPFTLLLRPLLHDETRKAFDAYLDGVARYFAEHANSTPGRDRTIETMLTTSAGRAAYRNLTIDFVLSTVIGWKNAPVFGPDDEPIADAPLNLEALREAFEEDQRLAEQAFLTLTSVRGGKQVRLD